MANRGETVKTVTDFIFLGSNITADGDCSHEINRRLLLGRKAMANLDSILKQQGHYFAVKGPSSPSCGFFHQSCRDVRVESSRKLSTKEMMLLNCGVGGDS